MNARGTVSGRLSCGAHLSADLATGAHLAGSLTIPASSGVPVYDGSVEVTPRLYEQGLETRNKLMLNDVTVHEIPITMTSNPQGGKTVLIG